MSFNFITKLQSQNEPLYQLRLDDNIHDESDKISCEDGLLAGMDMHPYPNLLIVFQGSLPFVPYDSQKHTTKTLWHFIWDYSSAINFRLTNPVLTDNKSKEMFKILRSIQSNLLYPNQTKLSDIIKEFPVVDTQNEISKDKSESFGLLDKHFGLLDKRIGFILLFGQKRTFSFKKKKYDIIIAGNDSTSKNICKIKYVVNNETKYLEDEDLINEIEMEFFKQFSDTIELPEAPLGYQWIWNNWASNKKVIIKTEIVDNKSKSKEIKFM